MEVQLKRKCTFPYWRGLNLVRLIVAVLMLLLGVLGDRLGLSDEVKSLILGAAIALLIELSVATFPYIADGSAAPAFTRFKLCNFGDMPAKARTQPRDSSGTALPLGDPRPIPVGPSADPINDPATPTPVPPGQCMKNERRIPPLAVGVFSVSTEFWWGPHLFTFVQEPNVAGDRVMAQELYFVFDPLSGKHFLHSSLIHMADTSEVGGPRYTVQVFPLD